MSGVAPRDTALQSRQTSSAVASAPPLQTQTPAHPEPGPLHTAPHSSALPSACLQLPSEACLLPFERLDLPFGKHLVGSQGRRPLCLPGAAMVGVCSAAQPGSWQCACAPVIARIACTACLACKACCGCPGEAQTHLCVSHPLQALGKPMPCLQMVRMMFRRLTGGLCVSLATKFSM